MIPLGARLAFRHLTVLPVPYNEAEAAALPSTSLPWFPVVGLVVGAGSAAILALPLPPLPRAALALAAGVALTGGLHEDGVMDVADAALPPLSRERRLEILRDPRVGAHGVTAATLAILLRFAALTSAPVMAPVLAGIASRWCMSMAITRWPSARPGGLGARFREGASAWPGTLVAVGLFAALVPSTGAPRALVAGSSAAVVGWATAAWLAGRLGGLNGDGYGAVGIAAETTVLLVLACLQWGHRGL